MNKPRVDGSLDTTDAVLLESRFLARLRWFATRLLGDAHAGEDAAQEAMRRVLQAVAERRVRDHDALPAFAFQTLRYVCSHHSRAAGRERRMLSGYGSEAALEEPAADPLAELVSSERRAAVRGALQGIADEDRQLLQALYVEEENPRKLAARLQLSEGALRTRKHRALKRLGRQLAGIEGR